MFCHNKETSCQPAKENRSITDMNDDPTFVTEECKVYLG